MEVHPQQRCYRAGGASREVRCLVHSAQSAKDVYALKNSLWGLATAAKEASHVIPEAKSISNVIAHRGKMLYRIADSLEEKVKSHEKFFFEQLRSLHGYAFELERMAYNSCIDKVYPEPKLSKLPSVPKNIATEVKKAKDKKAADERRRNASWARQADKVRRLREAAVRKRSSK